MTTPQPQPQRQPVFHRGSLTSRVFEFYKDNPHEWMTLEDMAAKFDCTARQAKTALIDLRRRGMMTIVAEVVYKVAQP